MHFIKVEGEVPIKGGGFDSFQGCLPPIQGGILLFFYLIISYQV